MKKVDSLMRLEQLIEHKIDLYDNKGHKISIITYMYNRLYDIWMDIKNENIFYNPDDFIR
jgi:hypothetical protein